MKDNLAESPSWRKKGTFLLKDTYYPENNIAFTKFTGLQNYSFGGRNRVRENIRNETQECQLA